MNQEVQKIIKASFCPKYKWVGDDDAFNCFKCDKKFHVIYRRKHHCRYCGQIFCATCSDFFFSGKDLGEAEKTIRMCEACIQKCWKYIAKHDDTYIEFRKSGELEGNIQQLPQNIAEIQHQSRCSFTEEEKLRDIQSIVEEYEGNQQNCTRLEQEVENRFVVLVQVILKQARIPLRYLPQIVSVAHQIVTKIQPNFVITGSMDVFQNVRVKGFFGEGLRLSVEGVVLIKKAFASKKVKEQYQNMTCILVYGNIESQDLVGVDKEASFVNMINNRLKQMNKIISYCERVKVNLIFLEGQIQKEFQDLLLASNITVIAKVKVEYLSRLKASLKIQKIVEAIGKVYAYPQQEITGQIKKMSSAIYFSAKQGNPSKRFFKVSTGRIQLGLTVIVQGEPGIVQRLKKELRFIVQVLTHMNLKICKVRMDQNLLDSMSQPLKKSCYINNPQMFFSFYAEFHTDILSYLKEKYVSFKHITYVQSDFSNYPEVTKPSLQQYLRVRPHSFKNKWENFTQICNGINDQHRMFYSSEDLPLGSFLLRKLTGLDKKCSVCCRPNYLHIDVYYSTDQYVKIWTQSMIIDNSEKQQSCYSSFASVDEPRPAQTEMIFTFLEKNTGKEKLKCFIECYDCQEPLSNHQNVYKSDLEYSILSFLHQMFKGSTETTIRENKTRKQKGKPTICSHIRKVRVYELGSKSVKIFVGRYTISRQCVMTESGRASFLKAKQNKRVIETCLLGASFIEKIVMFLYDEIKSIAELSKNPKFETMIRNPKSSFVKARHSILGNGNVRLSQAQCIDMILPELIEQVGKINTVAQFLLNMKRVEKLLEGLKMSYIFLTLLKKSYLIISEVKEAVKRRDLDMKYQVKDFDKDFLLEDIDINQLVDNFSSVDNESQQTPSDISKSQLYSNIQTLDTNLNDIDTYGWLQPYRQEQHTSRQDRKTQSNILSKKSNKTSEEQVFKIFKLISSNLKVDTGIFDFVPCYANKPQSLIANALNSSTHKQCLSLTSFQPDFTIRIGSYMEELPATDNEEIRKLITIMEIHQRMFEIRSKVKGQSTSVSLQITMLYPNQFEILRRKKSIPLELFVESIAGADQWLTSGGKSGSPFMRSFNDLLVIKKISKNQFITFRKFLPKYFTHLHEGSTLTPIYGAFTITRNLTTEYYIVMENLFFGMKQWYLYDFKGSITRRFSRPPVIPLDINFLIDRFSQPIFCKDNVLKNLSATLDYLQSNNVIDYSLILVVEIENNSDYYLDGNRFQIGIVDYMREFGAGEWVQNIWKGPEATVVEPKTYKQRMLKNLKKYFTQIPL